MPVPKRKRSRPRRDKRFANKGMKVKAIAVCQNTSCALPLSPHTACAGCGFYKGVKMLSTKQDRLVKRAESREKKAAQGSSNRVAQEG